VITAGTAVRPSGAAEASARASAARRITAVAGQSRPAGKPQLQRAIEAAPADDHGDALDELARQAEAAAPLEDAARCNHCALPCL
jgi:hypothetical protein